AALEGLMVLHTVVPCTGPCGARIPRSRRAPGSRLPAPALARPLAQHAQAAVAVVVVRLEAAAVGGADAAKLQVVRAAAGVAAVAVLGRRRVLQRVFVGVLPVRLRGVPVGAPLPGVAEHSVEPETVGQVGADGAGPPEAPGFPPPPPPTVVLEVAQLVG